MVCFTFCNELERVQKILKKLDKEWNEKNLKVQNLDNEGVVHNQERKVFP